MFASRERGLDVQRLHIDGQRDDNRADVRAGEERGVVFAIVVVGVGVYVALGDGGECGGRDEGAREDGFEFEEGCGFDGGLEEGSVWMLWL